eukprot:8934652-Karenia_brevis.AAC.1
MDGGNSKIRCSMSKSYQKGHWDRIKDGKVRFLSGRPVLMEPNWRPFIRFLRVGTTKKED